MRADGDSLLSVCLIRRLSQVTTDEKKLLAKSINQASDKLFNQREYQYAASKSPRETTVVRQ